MRPERTLVVWCPDWPVTAAGHRSDEPVVVVSGNTVVACSAAARAAGVARGLRRREAQARCPEAVVLAADPDRDARAFEAVVRAVEALVPGVAVLDPGTCVFPTRGPSRYFGGDEALAARVAAAVPVPCRTGIADGVFAATLAARRGRIVPPGESARFLASFPVGVLGMPELADLLVRLGVRTLGELAALPAPFVLARFGAEGLCAHRLASGRDGWPPTPRVPPPEFTVAAELDPPVERVDAAAFVARSLATELCGQLAARGLCCARVRVEAVSAHGESLARSWRHEGALTPEALAERVRWQLDGWLTAGGPSAGLTLVRLVPEEVHPAGGRQDGFWGGSATPERVLRAVARIEGMLGPGTVVTGVLRGSRHPAGRVCTVALGTSTGQPDRAPWPGAPPPPSPALVHTPPLPAELLDERGVPVRVSGRGVPSGVPARLAVAGGPWERVVAWAGPWLVDERWWDPAARVRRARWQVRTAGGAAHLVVLEGGRCRVEATYD